MINILKKYPSATVVVLLALSLSMVNLYSPDFVRKTSFEVIKIIAPPLGWRIDSVEQQVQECQSHVDSKSCVQKKFGRDEPVSSFRHTIAIFGLILLTWIIFPWRKILHIAKNYIFSKKGD